MKTTLPIGAIYSLPGLKIHQETLLLLGISKRTPLDNFVQNFVILNYDKNFTHYGSKG